MANTVCQGECNFFAVNCPGELSNFTAFTFKYVLEIILSIYGFKRHNFVSENIIGHPLFFFRLLSNAFSDFGSVGRKRKKKIKNKIGKGVWS